MKPVETMSPATDPLLRARWGRDWMVRDGWRAVIQIIPMEGLMTRPADQGRMTLVGAELEIGVRRSRTAFVEKGWRAPWRAYARFRSDADEIAQRQLEAAT